VARADAGPLDNPFVGSFNALGGQLGSQFGVGQSARWQIATGAGDA
jgi:hypothetical protein